MTVRQFIEFLKTLDQDRNIWVVYDRFQYQLPDIDILGIEGICKADSFRLPLYLERDMSDSQKPKDGDYFIDAY